MVKIKKKSPSRVRYDQGHPTVSCRVPKDLYERLQMMRTKDRKSFADFLKVGLGVLEVKVKSEAEIRQQGHDEGYRKGYADASTRYKVTFNCDKCGQIIEVIHPNIKEAIKGFLKVHGWGHSACHEKRE